MDTIKIYGTRIYARYMVCILGSIISRWKIGDIESHKKIIVEELLNRPLAVQKPRKWEERLEKMQTSKRMNLSGILQDIKRVIFKYMYLAMGDFVKRGISDEEDRTREFYIQLANRYIDMPEELKNLLKLGYSLAEALVVFTVEDDFEIENNFAEEDNLLILGKAINWTFIYRGVRTGKCAELDGTYMYEDRAKQYIKEMGLNKTKVIPLTRDCFSVNMSEVLGYPFHVTPSYFEMILKEYKMSSELPYTFCRIWLKENLITGKL